MPKYKSNWRESILNATSLEEIVKVIQVVNDDYINPENEKKAYEFIKNILYPLFGKKTGDAWENVKSILDRRKTFYDLMDEADSLVNDYRLGKEMKDDFQLWESLAEDINGGHTTIERVYKDYPELQGTKTDKETRQEFYYGVEIGMKELAITQDVDRMNNGELFRFNEFEVNGVKYIAVERDGFGWKSGKTYEILDPTGFLIQSLYRLENGTTRSISFGSGKYKNRKDIANKFRTLLEDGWEPKDRYFFDILNGENIQHKGTFDDSEDHITESSLAEAAREAMGHEGASDAQKKAGNYTKGHCRIAGFDITIENPAGSYRTGTGPDGKEWKSLMYHHYGYIGKTKAIDGDAVDVFFNPDIEDEEFKARPWFVIDQIDQDGKFDEPKVVAGYNTKSEAKAAYMANYSSGWEGLGDITKMSLDEFRSWVTDKEKVKKPVSWPAATE